jgi:hypothetical protein
VNAGEAGCPDFSQFVRLDAADGVGPGIGGTPLNIGKPFSQVLQDVDQIIRFDNRAVGVLQKDRLHTGVHPVQGGVKRGLFHGGKRMGQFG